MTYYRDTWTGRFAKKSTWKRSKAHGGTRYKRSLHAKPQEPITITRRQYKNSKGRVTHIEIRARGSHIISVRVGKREYTDKKDIEALGPLLAAAF